MQRRLLRLVLAVALFGGLPTTTAAQNASQFAKTLASQKADFESRIENLQREVDDLFADKSYCSAEERKEAYDKIRALQREIAALRNEYGAFKSGAIKTAATPGYGPQLDAAGVHPDDRTYWADDDNALAKLRASALAKANRIEQAPYRDCSEPQSTSSPPPPPAPAAPKPPKPMPEQPGSGQPPPPVGPTTPLGEQQPPGGCTDKEATDRRLRIQDEILKLEEELIPIDGTTPEGRARQLQLRAEIDRLAGLLSLPCPPRLPPMKPAIPSPKPTQSQPTQTQPAQKAVGGSKKGDGSVGQSSNPPDYFGDFKRALAKYRSAKADCDVEGMAAARAEMIAVQAAFEPVWKAYQKTSSIYGSNSDLLQWMEDQRKEAESESLMSSECPYRLIRPADPFDRLEYDADHALDGVADAMDDCDEDAVKEMIPHLEDLARQAHRAAEAARAAGGLSRIDPEEAEAMARDLDDAIKDAKGFRCILKPFKRYLRLDTIDERILEIHNMEREAVHVPALKWDYKLGWDSIGYAHALSVTHELAHAPREGRGIERENLGTGLIGKSPDRIMRIQWVGEKIHFHNGYFPAICDGAWSICAHYSQMIWPTTLKIGCGNKAGGGFVWLVCRYSPGGNKDGKFVGDMNYWIRARPIGGDYGHVPPPSPPPPPPPP